MVVDSGASWCNVVDRFLLEELKKIRKKSQGSKKRLKLYAYGSSKPPDTLESFIEDISVGNLSEFFVIQGNEQALMGH